MLTDQHSYKYCPKKPDSAGASYACRKDCRTGVSMSCTMGPVRKQWNTEDATAILHDPSPAAATPGLWPELFDSDLLGNSPTHHCLVHFRCWSGRRRERRTWRRHTRRPRCVRARRPSRLLLLMILGSCQLLRLRPRPRLTAAMTLHRCQTLSWTCKESQDVHQAEQLQLNVMCRSTTGRACGSESNLLCFHAAGKGIL